MSNPQLLKSLLLYFPVKIIPAATGFFFIIYLYRTLQDGQYVDYSMSASVAIIAAQVGGGWIGNAFVYYLPAKKDKAQFFYNSLLLVIASSLIISGVGVILTLLSFASIKVSIVIAILCVWQTVFYFLMTSLQAVFYSGAQLFAVVAQSVVQVAGLVILFLVLDNRFEYALIALTLGFCSGVLVMLPAIYRKFPLMPRVFDLNHLKEDVPQIIKYGGPMCVWAIAILIVSTGDRYIVGFLDLAGGDGYLSMKDLLLGASGLISMPILMLIHPLVLSKFRVTGFPVELIGKSISLVIILFSLFWTFWQIIGIPIFELLSKKEVGVSVGLILIVFLANLVGCINIYLQKRLEAHHRTMSLAGMALGTAVLSLILSFILAELVGLSGVAVAYLGAQLFYSLLIWNSAKRNFNVRSYIMWPLALGVTYWSVGVALWYIIQKSEIFQSLLIQQSIWVLIFGIIAACITGKGIFNLLRGE